MPPPSPALRDVEAFLCDLHGSSVSDVEPLAAGYWSSAFGYRLGDQELVLRVGTVREGFEMDREAMAFCRDDIPVPTVLDVGDAFGASYAISVRHHGRFLEEVDPRDAGAAGPAIARMFAAMRAVPAPAGSPAVWYGPHDPAATSTWRGWLTERLVDDPRERTHGWRALLARDPDLNRLFRHCEQRIHDLLDACPERRDLVHGDLLNRNVLLSPDASRVTAVFSWKLSVFGDFLYDVAWCTFWAPWHPGIAALDLWARALRSPLDAGDLEDAAARHHCYELQIAATHLGWSAWTGDDDALQGVASRAAAVLERGPHPAPAQ
ncbi:MAG TPA: phosphotransferase [Acidimicrobiales bacterium]|nr:phosphotransferase [Acidimicrobiales bacterium]